MASREGENMINSIKIKRMVGVAILVAMVVVLQVISNYVSFGTISITLALIPLTMAAILYGPLVGLGLGLIMGAIILIAPSTSTFLSFNIWYTILLCLLKTGMAGLISGLLFRLILKTKNEISKLRLSVAVIVSALITPIINTLIFMIGATFLFTEMFVGDLVSVGFGTAFVSVYNTVITLNFLIEFIVSAICSPALIYLVKVIGKQSDLGFQDVFKEATRNKLEENNSVEQIEVNTDDLFS